MEPEPRFPQRSIPAHPAPVFVGNRPTIFFVTVCTKGKKRILATPEFHHLILSAWHAADQYLVGRYIIMPNHVHFFCAPATSDAPPLAHWLRYWKSQSTKQSPIKPLWQRDHWDTQLRHSDSYSAKWTYISENPVRAGLVSEASSWPYQGEPNTLHWID